MTELTALHHERDAAVVRAWLAAHVRDHLRAWSETLGEAWTDAAIDEHAARHGLVEREWADLRAAADREPRGFVRLARQDGRPVGVLWAEERPDRFLCRPVAALCWVYVARAWRGRGVADALMAAYEGWAGRRPVVAREVYVTSSNAPALRLYERRGFVTSDHRLFAPAVVEVPR